MSESEYDLTEISSQELELWQNDQKLDADLRDFLSKENLSEQYFDQRFGVLLKTYGEIAYTELLNFLCHLVFTPDVAKKHLSEILALRKTMSTQMNQTVDLRVAMMQYFLSDISDISCLDKHKTVDIKFFEQMQESVFKDELTGLFNFRYLKSHLSQELHRAQRYGSTVSVMIFDIDDFKTYNDQHGHEMGNTVLKIFADILQQTVRKMDSAIRYGGEEFVLILPATRKEGAVIVYERIQEALQAANIAHAKEQPLGLISASAGIASYPSDTEDPGKLLEHADAAMYMAKYTGKNRYHCYGANRRSNYRVRTCLNGWFTLGGNKEKHSLNTVDISESGLLIETEHDIPVGTLTEIHLRMPDGQRELPFPARILRHQPGDKQPHSFALQLIEIPTQDRLRLQNFVRDYAEKDKQESEAV